jgi:hypothetical protein
MDALTAQLKQIQQMASQMPRTMRAKLSSGAQNLLRLAESADNGELQSNLPQLGAALHGTLGGQLFTSRSETLPPFQVNDPSTDLAFSRNAGLVHSETSTAWCGQNVVVAYNDSGSLPESFQPLSTRTIGLSFNGYSRSTDGGRTFIDQGFLNDRSDCTTEVGVNFQLIESGTRLGRAAVSQPRGDSGSFSDKRTTGICRLACDSAHWVPK